MTDPRNGAQRVSELRAQLAARNLDGYLVPRADEHQGEYVPKCAERLFWLTGFSGSAGLAIILADKAGLFVDGRYTVQSRHQADGNVFEFIRIPDTSAKDWLLANLLPGAKIGFDPRLHTVSEIKRLGDALGDRQIKLEAVPENLVDQIWSERPAAPVGPVVAHSLQYSGRTATDKISDIRAEMEKRGATVLALTMPDSIAWLFNIRGSDVAHTPVVLSYALIHAEAPPELFVDPNKLDQTVRGHLEPVCRIVPPGELATRLRSLGADGAKVQLDPNSASTWIATTLEESGAEIISDPDPCLLAKACKNETEMSGARTAHLRDGAVLCRFLAWLDREAPSGAITEISAAQKLEQLRRDTGLLVDISFDTISGTGPNAALPHYRVSETSSQTLIENNLYLTDSGGQFRDGTTDVTRTIAIGTPSAEMCDRFTRVLKGHIAISSARFPVGTRGIDLDPFARRALWDGGLDFDHGTGHGVGSFLSVHEGPASISKRGMVALKPGMILSNEPGYYKVGAYGIRIENLELVRPAEPIGDGDRAMLSFETLTLAPIDRRLICLNLLENTERNWLDTYHQRVFDEIGPALEGDDVKWLAAATVPIALDHVR